MKLNRFYALICVSLLTSLCLLSSCANPLESRTEFLTSGTWKIQTISSPSVPQEDLDA